MGEEKFIRRIVIYSIPTVIAAIVGFLVIPVISYVYPEEQYAAISNFYTYGLLIRSLTMLGLDSAYIRFFYDAASDNERSGMFQFVLKISILFDIILFFICILINANRVSMILFGDYSLISIGLLCIYVIELSIFRLLNLNYRYMDRRMEFNLQQIAFTLCNRVLFVLGVFISKKYLCSILIMVILNFFIIAISSLDQKKIFGFYRLDKFKKKQMLLFSMPMLPATVVTFINDSFAKYYLGYKGLMKDLGVLSLAINIASVFSVFSAGFSVFWGPYVYKNYKEKQDIIKQIHDCVFFLIALFAIAIFVFQDIIYYFLSDNYHNSQKYFMLLMIVPITLIMNETTGYGITIAKKTIFDLLAIIIGGIANIVICTSFIEKSGSLGAAFGLAISSICVWGIKAIISQAYYKSIINGIRTFCGAVVIFGICIINVFFFNDLHLRIIITASSFFITILLYRKSIYLIFYAIRNLIINRSNK